MGYNKPINPENEIHPALDASYYKGYSHQRRMIGNVSDIQKSTGMPSPLMKSISRDIGTSGTQQRLIPESSQTSTCSAEDSPASLFPLLEKGRVSRILEALCSMRYAELPGLKDLDFCFSRMSKGSFQQTMDGALLPSSHRWMNWGMMSNGRFLTANISECRRTGKGCSLSDILEENPASKYFLSDKAVQKLIRHNNQSVRPFIKDIASKAAGISNILFPTAQDVEIPRGGGTGLMASDEHCFTLDSSPHILALDLYNNKQHPDRTPALSEPHHNSLRMQVGGRIRRLTPVECERLQGFPDNWTLGSDTQRYWQCGNAVTVNVIQAIAEGMLK